MVTLQIEEACEAHKGAMDKCLEMREEYNEGFYAGVVEQIREQMTA